MGQVEPRISVYAHCPCQGSRRTVVPYWLSLSRAARSRLEVKEAVPGLVVADLSRFDCSG
jgi:hypothetical protein